MALLAPFLTRSEVLKVGITHCANIIKAKGLLGYQVKVSSNEAMQKCIQWFEEHEYRKTNSQNIYENSWLIILDFIKLPIFYFYQFDRHIQVCII